MGPTLALVVLAGIVGICLVRLQGFVALRRAQATFEQREVPARELFGAACILVAGVLLLIPGFASDAIGLLLLIPAVRAGLRRWLWSRLSAGSRRGGSPQAPRRRQPIIDADYTVVEAPERPRSPWDRPRADGNAQ